MEAGISLPVYQYRRVPKGPLQVHMSPAEDIFCLLYTSDAADE